MSIPQLILKKIMEIVIRFDIIAFRNGKLMRKIDIVNIE